MIGSNVYIMKIAARLLTEPFIIDTERKGRLYKGSIARSPDLLHLEEVAPEEFWIIVRNQKVKWNTDAIIDVSFEDPLRELVEDEHYSVKDLNKGKLVEKTHSYGEVVLSSEKLKLMLGTNGFTIVEKGIETHYVPYGRSASKARENSKLFIKESLHAEMDSWSKLDIEYSSSQRVDIASIEAYRMLGLSAAIGIVNIQPHEILLIDDKYSSYKSGASVTVTVAGEVEVIEKNIVMNNNLWDGQSLADTTLFSAATFYESDQQATGKGMLLLRNREFKSCAFHTKIQDFIDSIYPQKKPRFIRDMFGREILTEDIKLITTPSSIKFLKKWENFPATEADVDEALKSHCETLDIEVTPYIRDEIEQRLKMKVCYEYWLKYITLGFSIVKHEKENADDYQRGAYQFWNTLPLTRDDALALLQDEIEYVTGIQNDIECFKRHLNISENTATADFISALISVNSDAQYTAMYKEYNSRIVYNYKKKLRRGKIKVSQSANCVLCGNPYEMLFYAIKGRLLSTGERLTGSEVWCSNFVNGEKLAMFRSPHIASGNILLAFNRSVPELQEYFHLTDNIIVVDTTSSYIPQRLQGSDFDSDFCWVSANPLVVNAVDRCNKLFTDTLVYDGVTYPTSYGFSTPVNAIDSEKRLDNYSMENIVSVDHKIAQNYIGQIVNWSQLLNSYYWHYYNRNDGHQDDLLTEIYERISMLSSLSQCEIDKAKKLYNIDVQKYIKEIREWDLIEKAIGVEYNAKNLPEKEAKEYAQLYEKKKACKNATERRELADKMKDIIRRAKESETVVYPNFFKLIHSSGIHAYKAFDTPMEYIYEMIGDKGIFPERGSRTKSIGIEKLVAEPNFSLVNKKQISHFRTVCQKAYKQTGDLYPDDDLDSKARAAIKRDITNDAIAELRKSEYSDNTLRAIIYKAFVKKAKFADTEIYGMRKYCIGLLYKAHGRQLMECFRSTRQEES